MPGVEDDGFEDVYELTLNLPKEENVEKLFKRGGALLAAHTHIPLRNHAGRREFRMLGPLYETLRITTAAEIPI